MILKSVPEEDEVSEEQVVALLRSVVAARHYFALT
jgi:hypothetical protein